jgi:hypothetical protein
VKQDHVHKWRYDKQKEQWSCRGCGEVVTQREFIRRFCVMGNVDVTPAQGLDRIAKERQRV